VGKKFSDGICKYLPHLSLSYVIIMSLNVFFGVVVVVVSAAAAAAAAY